MLGLRGHPVTAMAACKKLTSLKELRWVMRNAAEISQLGKHVSQLVRDVSEKRLQANVFVDQWPKFTTVITQELTPRLSEVADLRIFSKDREKVMPIINEANLLGNIGAWQLIHYVEEDSEELAAYLMDSLQNHPATKDRSVQEIFDYDVYEIKRVAQIPIVNLPPGFYAREIRLTDAEFMAKHWIPAAVDYPLEIKTQFIKDIVTKMIMVGVYKTDGDERPVSWFGQKPGGMVGMGYTLKEYRNKHLYEISIYEALKRSEARDNYVMAEFHAFPENLETFGKLDRTPIGKSKIIAIT